MVCAAFLAYIFFTGPILNLFTPMSNTLESSNGLPVTGVVVEDVSVGEGELAETGDTIIAHYSGRLADGRTFDSSYERGVPINFTLGVGQVIRGWDEGLLGMRVGGKRILKIAPDFGYGAGGAGSIPPNSPLIFEIELVDVKKSQ